MKILITGSTGSLGRNLLASAPAGVHELILPRRAEFDLVDPSACREMYRRHRPDLVIHLAAKVGGIQDNIDHPVEFLVENTLISTNVIHEAYRAGVPRLLNLASSCMYPRDLAGPLSPDSLLTAPLEPTNEGYALAKIMSWKLTEYINHESADQQYVTLVACNLYGVFDDFRPLYSHLVQSAIVKTIEALETGEPSIEVWGDGTARREFLFMTDLAEFIWQFVPRFGALPSLMNVGAGTDHTVREYYEVVAEVLGFRGEHRYDASKPMGMARKLLDVSPQEALGWRPQTDLRTGIARTADYYRRHRAQTAR